MGMRFGHELDKDFRYPGDMWSAHRVRMIAACRAAGIDAIDGPFGDFRNDKAYLKQATWSASLGAVGKWCIHPNQIPLANDVFAPSPREIEQAQKMVDLYNESVAKGAGAGGKGGQLVDAATLRIYEPVLERARATGSCRGESRPMHDLSQPTWPMPGPAPPAAPSATLVQPHSSDPGATRALDPSTESCAPFPPAFPNPSRHGCGSRSSKQPQSKR